MSGSGWQAQLELSFARDGAHTRLRDRRHSGPLRVQRPFYPEGAGVCHVYVLHPPGGVVAGDLIELSVTVEPGAHALVTTPAATKLYRSGGASARQLQTLRVAAGATLEWLPQETIAFDGAQVELATHVELEPGARYLGWEVLCLGRPAAQERFARGTLCSALELSRAGQLHYTERGVYSGGSAVLTEPWGLAGQPVVATLLCVDPGVSACLAAARELTALIAAPARAAVSCWDDLLIARYLGPSVEQARSLFSALWSQLRGQLQQRAVSAPRIWLT